MSLQECTGAGRAGAVRDSTSLQDVEMQTSTHTDTSCDSEPDLRYVCVQRGLGQFRFRAGSGPGVGCDRRTRPVGTGPVQRLGEAISTPLRGNSNFKKSSCLNQGSLAVHTASTICDDHIHDGRFLPLGVQNPFCHGFKEPV